MSQAQFAGGAGPDNDYSARGHVIRNFALLSGEGKQVQLADYRGRANLVIVLGGAPGDPSSINLLRELAGRYPAFREQEAAIIAVLACTREQAQAAQGREHFPFALLADSEATVHRVLRAWDDREPRLAIYVTDRFAEVFAVYRTAQGDAIPSAHDLLEWLDFVNRQCPECFPPEWPA